MESPGHLPPSFDDLLKQHKLIDSSLLDRQVSKDHLFEFSCSLDGWERLGHALHIPTDPIKTNFNYDYQGLRMLEEWNESHGPRATYKVLVKALLMIRSVNKANSVVSMVARDKPLSDANSRCTMPSSLLNVTRTVHTAQQEELLMTLNDLEEDFFNLVTKIELALTENNANVNLITRRFRMLSELVKWHHRTDNNYTITRQKVINSKTVTELFDNLTELKNWNYAVSADTLAYILKDIKVPTNNIHQDIDKFRNKLASFKRTTLLKDVITLSLPIPDYFKQLTVEVEDWENKLIDEAEKIAMKTSNIQTA